MCFGLFVARYTILLNMNESFQRVSAILHPLTTWKYLSMLNSTPEGDFPVI